MKPVKLFYLRSCPFCKKALRYIDEARAAHPELAAVGIEMIEESEQPEVAEVLAVGPGGMVDGKEVELILKPGDKVITSKYMGTDVKIAGEQLTIVKQSDVVAIVED